MYIKYRLEIKKQNKKLVLQHKYFEKYCYEPLELHSPLIWIKEILWTKLADQKFTLQTLA